MPLPRSSRPGGIVDRQLLLGHELSSPQPPVPDQGRAPPPPPPVPDQGRAPPPQALPKKGDGDGSAAAAIDDATLALLEELNAPDMRLYEYATTLMYHRIATAAQVGRWGVGLVRRASAKRRTNDERTKGRRDEGTNERMDQWTNERME